MLHSFYFVGGFYIATWLTHCKINYMLSLAKLKLLCLIKYHSLCESQFAGSWGGEGEGEGVSAVM